MVRRPFRFFGVVALASLWPMNALCIGVPALRLDILCNDSNLVVVGKVGSFVKVGDVSMTVGDKNLRVNLMESSVEIIGRLKGDEQAEVIRMQVPVLQPTGGSVFLDGIRSNSIRLLFLQRLGDGLYRVTDPRHPSLPGIPTSFDSATLVEKVAAVECRVSSSDSSALNDKLDAIWSLRGVDAACIVPALRGIASGTGSILSLTAEAELMRRGDTLLLERAIADALSEHESGPEYLKGNILSSIEVGKFSAAAVPLLSEMVKNSQARARLAGARALMGIGTQSCTPSLRSLLSDSDQRVRYAAVIALADINSMPDRHPSIQEFQEHEERYIGYWKRPE